MRWYKGLKRRYRLKRLLFPLLGIGLLVLLMSIWIDKDQIINSSDIPVYHPNVQLQDDGLDLQAEHVYTVTKHNVYVCGEETEQAGTWTGEEILTWLQADHNREGTLLDQDSVRLTEHILDLSDACKGQVYFGMDAGDNLTLFEGEPNSDNNKVLQTFFQIDIEYLESSLPQQTIQSLYEGIRIHDYEEYNSVLSTFASFAVESIEN